MIIKAVKTLLGFKVRVVQTFDPPGTYIKLVYIRRSVPMGYRIQVAYRVLKHTTKVDNIAGLYAMQILKSESERRGN